MQNTKTPLISVVMPVYNSSLYLHEAIDSILAQTFSNFEFLILNDGSTDRSQDIILSYQDERIKFIDYPLNLGLAARLNTGIQIAQGKYVARMDSDDVALPERFEKQLFFMEQNKDVAVCGGFINFIGKDVPSTALNWVTHTDKDLIKINLLFDCAICHPTVMFRKEILNDNKITYDSAYEPAEDYKMWLQMSNKDLVLVNMKDILLYFRINNNQVSIANNNEQRVKKFQIMREQLIWLGITPTRTELLLHDRLFFQEPILTIDYIPKIKEWINKLIASNATHAHYDPVKFEAYLNNLLDANISAFNSRLKSAALKEKIKFLIKKTLRIGSVNNSLNA